MKSVEKWKWRIRWAGRWTTTLVPFTEDQVRSQHPEAVRVDGSRVLAEMPESEAEIAAEQRAGGENSVSVVTSRRCGIYSMAIHDPGGRPR